MRTPDDILDELAVIRCRQGDSEALRELVDRWHQKLFRFAARLTEDTEAASDVVQDAWVAIVKGIGQLQDPACFRRWAYRIVSNKCADWIRRQQRLRQASEPMVAEPQSNEQAAEPVMELSGALRRLSRDKRTVVSMYYLDSMSVAEISHALSLPEGTVKSRLYQARQALRLALEQTYDGRRR